MDFSPRHAETLQLSPSHFHNVGLFHDELRRSISRSPSKAWRVQKSGHESPTSPSSRHSPLSQQHNAHGSHSPLSRTPRDPTAPSTSRKMRPALTRATPIKSNLFHPPRQEMTSQQSRRPLSIASDLGNSSSNASSQEQRDGQENQATTPDGSPPDSQIFTVPRPKPAQSPFRLPSGRPKSIAVTEREFLRDRAPAKSSPLKRSDGLLNMDRPSFGSPSAKRRSLHGASFEIAKDEEVRTEWMHQSDEESDTDVTPFRTTVPPRFGGVNRRLHGPLRAQDRANTSRNRRSLEFDSATPIPRRNGSKNKSRASLDSGIGIKMDFEGGFESSPVPEQRHQFAKPGRPQPHPLSKALTPGSPLQSNMPTAFPTFGANPPDTPDTRPAFSKSLPIGAIRPHLRGAYDKSSVDSSSTEMTFSTPKPFDDARPDPAAFRSTGLISKKHRDPDDMPPPPGGHGAMPDTPCKKMPGNFDDQASPTSITSIAKPRFGQPLFGTPARPLEGGTKAHGSSFRVLPPKFAPDGESNRLTRSTSFVSNDGSDSGRSPSGSHVQGESHSSADELPPTPTKQIFGFTSVKNNIKNSSLRSSLFGRRTSVGPNTFAPSDAEQTSQDQQSTHRLCKSSHSGPGADTQGLPPRAPVALERIPVHPCSSDSPLPSFARSRQIRRRSPVKGPSPLSERSLRSSYRSTTEQHAKTGFVPIVTQSLSIPAAGTPVPQTPAETAIPDPSQLSISPNYRGARTPSWRSSLRATFSKAPETPSAGRNDSTKFDFAGVLATPSHHAATGRDVDSSLSERFKKVVWLGSGEFSEVYKVHQSQERSASGSFFSPSNVRSNSRQAGLTPLPNSVFVVKRTKAPLHGSKVRERTIREAQIMQALGRHDNVVTLIESWEARNHLYLMTEFCEEGTLDQFLARTGREGRLDDFRIWKIMLEVGAGLKHIHDSGFLHLDLKPENIFIDFSGVLKIGDFGLASHWPAPKSVEGEGDRRYIGPDLLLGNFDKPADVFAFGMMVYEIAGNFVPPDNGTNWHKLRSGDFSGLPSLTSGSSNSISVINSSNFTTTDSYDHPPFSPNTMYSSRPELDKIDSSEDVRMASTESLTTPRVGKSIRNTDTPPTELAEPPLFMLDPQNSESLDNVVHWMMLPLPQDRPTIDQVLGIGSCRWVAERRRAGAVVWEGKWGPSNAVLHPNSTTQEHHDERRMSGIYQEPQASQGTFFDDADAEMMDA